MFFNQAGAYLRHQADDKVVTMVRDRFRANPQSHNLWSAMWGLSQAGTPAAYGALEEIVASPAVREDIRKQAQSFLDQRTKLEETAER
jgi:hypothetical protein